MIDDLGDRMKMYERMETDRRVLPLLPIYARIDGAGFSKFTRGMKKPFDKIMSSAMIKTTKGLIDDTHALLGYTQSDEISLCWYSDDYLSGIIHNGKMQKLVSRLASKATAYFTQAIIQITKEHSDFQKYVDRAPEFDARVFHMPNKDEIANMFLWRNQDATKNTISSAARAHYSHKALQKKSGPDMQEMLFSKGINFNDYDPAFKRGTFVRRVTREKTLSNAELLRIPESKRPEPGHTFTRSSIEVIDMPPFSKVTNREGVIFNKEKPIEYTTTIP